MARKIDLDKDGELKRLAQEFNNMQSEEDLREASEDANAQVLAQKAKADGVLPLRAIIIVFAALAVIIIGVTWWVLARENSPRISNLPAVVTKNALAAKKQLTDAGFRVVLHYDASSQAQAGTVTAQEPPAGERLNPGDDVVLTVAGAEPGKIPATPTSTNTHTLMIMLPDVVGMEKDKAKRMLEILGLRVQEEIATDATAPQNAVLSSNPKAGSTVQPGATVQLNINAAQATGNATPAPENATPTPESTTPR